MTECLSPCNAFAAYSTGDTGLGRFCVSFSIAGIPARRFELLFRNLNRRTARLERFALLVSVDSFASFRLRRQPTGLTIGSLPPSLPLAVLLIREFEAAWAAQKKRITVKVIRFLWSIGDSNS